MTPICHITRLSCAVALVFCAIASGQNTPVNSPSDIAERSQERIELFGGEPVLAEPPDRRVARDLGLNLPAKKSAGTDEATKEGEAKSQVADDDTVQPRESESKVIGRGGGSTRRHDFSGTSQDSQPPPETSENPMAEWFSLRDATPLLIVVGLIILMAWLVKRFMPSKNLLTGGKALEIVARLPVGSKQHILLVKAGRRLVVVGQSPDAMQTLAEITDPDQIAMLLGEAATTSPGSVTRSFADAFQKESEAYDQHALFEESAPDESESDAISEASDDIAELVKKVRQLARGREVA